MIQQSKPRNYGWKPHLMAQNLTPAQLEALMIQVETEHANPRDERGTYTENGAPSLFLLDAKGRKKLDSVTWAMYHQSKKKT